MTEQITFNTGRGYSPDGQVIVAHADGHVVRFHDLTRCIAGEINAQYDERTDHLREFVLTNYDEGNYYDEPKARRLKPAIEYTEGGAS